MNHLKQIGLFSLTLVLAACVTINIYFPAAAAEEAARVIVRDVMGKEAPEAPAPSQPAPESSPGSSSRDQGQAARRVSLVEGVLNFFISPARAEADINIRTPAVDSVRSSLAQRRSKLNPYFNSGAIGLTRDGLVEIRDLSAVPLRERNTLKKLVAEENSDRNALYREIARANGHPEWEKNIRETFARVWVEEAPAGQWYEDKSGQWKQK